MRLSQRIRVGRQRRKILDHPSKCRKSRLDNIPRLSAEQQNICQQSEKQIDTELCQQSDSAKTMQQRIGIYKTGNQQNDNGNCSPIQVDME